MNDNGGKFLNIFTTPGNGEFEIQKLFLINLTETQRKLKHMLISDWRKKKQKLSAG